MLLRRWKAAAAAAAATTAAAAVAPIRVARFAVALPVCGLSLPVGEASSSCCSFFFSGWWVCCILFGSDARNFVFFVKNHIFFEKATCDTPVGEEEEEE